MSDLQVADETFRAFGASQTHSRALRRREAKSVNEIRIRGVAQSSGHHQPRSQILQRSGFLRHGPLRLLRLLQVQ